MTKQLYVVRRPFRTGGEFFGIGTILEDLSTIKRGRLKLTEGKIIPLPREKEEIIKLHHYFKGKFGVDLVGILNARISKGSESAEPTTPKDNTPPPGTPEAKPLSGKASAPKK